MTDRPLLIYDGDCGFCTRSARLAARLPVLVSMVPWQDADLAEAGVPESRVRREVVFVDETGRNFGGSAAVAALLRHCRGPWPVLGRLIELPVVRLFAASVYRLIADHRHRLPGETPACRLPSERRPGRR